MEIGSEPKASFGFPPANKIEASAPSDREFVRIGERREKKK